MSRDEILEELVESGELYLSLDCRIKTGSVLVVRQDVIASDPTADLVILREDIWEHILEISRLLQAV